LARLDRIPVWPYERKLLWIVGAGYFAWGFMFWGFLYWLPSYLSKSFGLSLTAVGAFSVAPWAAGLVGAVIGGVLVDRMYKKSRRIRSRFMIIGIALLLSGASMIPVIVAPSLVTALTSISLGVGFGFITGGIWWVVSIDAEPSQPASAAGFADAAFALSGIVAPSVMGFIVQGTNTFTSGFVTMAVLAVVAAVLMIGCTRERHATAPATEKTVSAAEGLG
jgi:nitrate/nitrite transporter NarK